MSDDNDDLVTSIPQLEDITPPDSVAPVYLDPTPDEPVNIDVDADIAAGARLRASAIKKLTLGKPLTTEEAELITGGTS